MCFFFPRKIKINLHISYFFCIMQFNWDFCMWLVFVCFVYVWLANGWEFSSVLESVLRIIRNNFPVLEFRLQKFTISVLFSEGTLWYVRSMCAWVLFVELNSSPLFRFVYSIETTVYMYVNCVLLWQKECHSIRNVVFISLVCECISSTLSLSLSFSHLLFLSRFWQFIPC